MKLLNCKKIQLFISLIFTIIGLVLTVARDVYLNQKVNTTEFIIIITVCSMLTSPFGEYAKHGLENYIIQKYNPFFTLAILFSLFWITLNNIYLNFYLTILLNILIAFYIAALIGILSSISIVLIRAISPIYPLINILLVYLGINDVNKLTLLSYTAVLIVVNLTIYSRKNYLKKYDEKAIKNLSFKNLLFQYCIFYVTNLLTLVNSYIFKESSIIALRLPIYTYNFYIILEPFLPKKILNISTKTLYFLIVINVLIIFIFLCKKQ